MNISSVVPDGTRSSVSSLIQALKCLAILTASLRDAKRMRRTRIRIRLRARRRSGIKRCSKAVTSHRTPKRASHANLWIAPLVLNRSHRGRNRYRYRNRYRLLCDGVDSDSDSDTDARVRLLGRREVLLVCFAQPGILLAQKIELLPRLLTVPGFEQRE